MVVYYLTVVLNQNKKVDTKTKELLSNTFLFTIANMGSKILVFLMVPFYTYVLTPWEYGIAGVVQTTASLLFLYYH